MNEQIKNRIKGALLGLSLLVGIGVTTSGTAQAQWQNDQWRRERAAQREQIRRQRELQRQQIRRQRAYRNDGRSRTDDWRYNNGGSYDLQQTALNAGYNEGVKEGRKDRQSGERFEFRDEEDYRNANTDYNSRLGNRGLYQQYFRQGFANGYNDGYRGY